MPDSYTEVTELGLFARIKRSIKGILAGIVLILVSFPVLWFNEGNSAKSHAGLRELSKAAVSVPSDKVDPANDGKPVHLTGEAATTETLTDPRFKVSANAIKLATTVEMYQWRESKSSTTEKKLGGGEKTVTTYEYSKEWSSRPIDSSRFKEQADHVNQPMPYKGSALYAKNVTLGAFKLSENLIHQVGGDEPLVLTEEHRAALPGDVRLGLRDDGPGYYKGQDPSSPQVGDIRIRFSIVKPAVVSLVAAQRGDSFTDFVSRNGKKFSLLEMGRLGLEEIVAAERSQLKILTWILRFVGWLLMFIGFTTLFKPLSVVADILPIFGDIIETGAGFVAALVAAALSLTTIAVAWIAYRPVIAIPLLVVSIALAVLAFKKIGTARKTRTAAAAA